MKRRQLLKHLRRHGCELIGEGGKHSTLFNPANGRSTRLPRHTEIDAHLMRGICKQLDIPIPSER